VFKNAQERNAAVKRQRNFLLSHQRLPSLNFFTCNSENTIRKNHWKTSTISEIETNRNGPFSDQKCTR